MSSQCHRSSGAGFASPRAIVSGILAIRLQSGRSIQRLKMHRIQLFAVAGLRTVYLLPLLPVPTGWQLMPLAFLLILFGILVMAGRRPPAAFDAVQR